MTIPRIDKLNPPVRRDIGQRSVRPEKLEEQSIETIAAAQVPPQTTATHKALGAVHDDLYNLTYSNTSLTVTLDAGQVRMAGATIYSHSPTGLTLTASQTNYIYVSAAGAISVSIVSSPSDSIPLWQVTTDAMGVTGATSMRALLSSGGLGGGGGSKIQDLDADTSIDVEQAPDEDAIRFRIAGTERALWNSGGQFNIGNVALAAGERFKVSNNVSLTTAQTLESMVMTSSLAAGISQMKGVDATGTITLNGFALTTFVGMDFRPTLSGSGGGGTVTDLKGLRAQLAFTSSPVFTDARAVHAVRGALYTVGAGSGTVVGFECDHLGHANIANVYGLRIAALTAGTNQRPIYEQGSTAGDGHGNRFRSNTMFGSLTGAFGGGDGVIGIANATTAPTTNPAGGIALASIGNQLKQRGLMGVNESLQSTLSAQAAGAAQNTFTAETVLNSTTFNVPANALVAGAVLRITARGVMGTTGTPTLTLRCRWGGVAGVLLGNTGAITQNSGVTDQMWEISFVIRVATIGATGTFECQGWYIRSFPADSQDINPLSNTGVITVDTTAAKDLVLTAAWSASSASNTITVRQYILERIA